MAKLIANETTSEQLARIKKWQVEVMGNTCSICHGDNAQNKCDACGWWGKVAPQTDVVFLRELDSDDIFALFPALAACANRTDLMVCYAHVGQHGSASYDYCNECDEVTDADEFADLFNELERAGYELYVIRKDRFNTFKYAAERKREDRFGNVTGHRGELC